MTPGGKLLPVGEGGRLTPGFFLVAWATLWFGAIGCGADSGPRIDSVLPASAVAGTAVDILGHGFDGQRRFASFAGVAGEADYWHSNRVRVRVPTVEPGLVFLVVTVDGRPSAAWEFVVERPRDG